MSPAATPAQIAAAQRDHERHFVKRAKERFDLRVSPERYREFIRKVTENLPGTKFLGHQPPNRTVWRIRAGGHFMRVVFDHVSECLVTCLPYGEEKEATINPHKVRRLRRAGRSPWR